ncbi:MerR family transcriptional regulator [Acetivibrio straminisolvens]|uniref:MerR family transcriptional regulator n=1 Tax=Acetivibrio straminisolvens TaxID=253314 RepID=UPI00223F4EF3|nr:MerR family transcriptional regulator [Acetivibrio straminisolvens]
MEVMKDRYSITELSEYLNVTDHTLRYYEREFNLYVPKDKRGRRCYTPELANIMYKIKAMRDDGLEIKAIKKILQSENIITEPPPVVTGDISVPVPKRNHSESILDIKTFFQEFEKQLTNSFSQEVELAKEHMTNELNKTKLELGACFENNVRRLESKLDKHFENVDRSIGMWREKNKDGLFKRLRKKVFRL